jgi:hypothetical protein
MAKFRGIKTLQKFAAAHASIHNHFDQDHRLNRRDVFKQNRAAALAEGRQLARVRDLTASDEPAHAQLNRQCRLHHCRTNWPRHRGKVPPSDSLTCKKGVLPLPNDRSWAMMAHRAYDQEPHTQAA